MPTGQHVTVAPQISPKTPVLVIFSPSMRRITHFHELARLKYLHLKITDYRCRGVYRQDLGLDNILVGVDIML